MAKAQKEEQVNVMKPDAEDDADLPVADSENADILVVVSKGHTLYHDGEKYPQFRRLEMNAEEADRLLKRGVVVRFDNLLQQVQERGG